MAFDKKTSSSPDRGKVRSTEELETYGVWVKSEPQDMASEMAGAANFGNDAMPFDIGGYGNVGMPNVGMEPSDIDIDFDTFDNGDFSSGFEDGSFVSGPFEKAEFTEATIEESDFDSEDSSSEGEFGQEDPFDSEGTSAKDEVSSQLLLKMADELSSIRSELNTMKKEFAELRAERGYDEKSEASGTGFFSGEDDGKITLTDSEMDDILASSLTGESDVFDLDSGNAFDSSLRDEDAAALRELSRQNEAAAARRAGGETKETGFDDLDIEEIGGVETDIQDRLVESETDGIFDTDLDFLTGEADASGLGIGDDDVFQAFAGELPSADMLEDMDELRDLRMHGADPLTPPPDDSSYLEEELFIGLNEDTPAVDADEDSLPPWPLSESEEDDVIGDAPGGAFFEDISLDSEFVMEDIPPLDDDDDAVSGAVSEEDATMYSSDDEAWPLSDVGLDSEPYLDGEISMDDELSSISDDTDDELSIGDLDDDQPADDETPSLEDSPSMDDELSLPPWLLSEEGLAEAEAESPGEVLLEAVTEADIEPPVMELEDMPSVDFADEEIILELDDETNETSNNETNETVMDISDPLSDDLMLDEPMFEDISLEMDEMDGMESFDIDDPAIEDSTLMREIPEGFQIDAEEALVSDDDLEAITEDEEIPPAAIKPESPPVKEADAADEATDISLGLKKDLKDVLAYMDQLLESLPEDKIEEFAKSDHFDTYRKLFKELGL